MASKEFHFHYVKTPTGAISGQSVLTQTEDAINDLGDYMFEATGDATEALNKATEALNTANTAQQNAAEALSTANSALGSVNTLTITVNSWDERIKKAESNAANAVTAATEASNNASQAVTTANSALNTAQQAVTTANAAKTTAQNASAAATQAVGTADAANATAEEAKKIAQQAVTDTDGIRDEINQSMVLITQKVNEATTQAQNSASSAAQSQANSDLSKRWATWTTGVETEDGTDYTVADDSYSSKWNAQLAQAWAVKTDGKVTENNLPDGAEIDYSSKYYAQQAKASETAAKASQDAAAFSASAAKTSETNAASSKAAAASSASAASTSATNASNSQKAAASSATSAANAQKAAEAARDLAQQYASQNAHAVVYDAQTLTATQQAQARKNIGAISAAEAPAPDLTPYLTKDAAASTYLGISAKAKSAATADRATTANSAKAVPWTGVSGKPQLIPGTGDAGTIKTYETVVAATAVGDDSARSMSLASGGTLTVNDGSANKAWITVVALAGTATINFGASWGWSGSAPTLAKGLVTLAWSGTFGVATFTKFGS